MRPAGHIIDEMSHQSKASDHLGRRSRLVAALVLAGAGLALADEPLRPPEPRTVCSPSQKICATSLPGGGTFIHEPGNANRDDALWSLPEWHRVFFVSDEGVLITGYAGINLVPKDDPSSTVVLEFWRDAKRVASYTLAELGYPRKRLQRTASHYHWGGYLGLDDDGMFRLEMVDQKVLVFDPSSGLLVRSEEVSDG